VRLVSAGFAFAGAIDVDGRLWTWGSNSSQALGRATDDKYSCEPAIVVGLPKLTQLSAGSDMMYATDINGKVWGWGQYSDGKFSISKSRPTLFAQVDHPASIYGYHGALYWIDQSGIAWETGHGIFSSPEPQPVPLLSKVNTPAPVSSVSLALQRAVAIDEKGSLWGWSGETTNFPGTVMNPRHIPFITE
jgi:alpha-tubulin suppressor-like RCC1 family protein